jgi:tetratricopeptide (TPR) repeat protein
VLDTREKRGEAVVAKALKQRGLAFAALGKLDKAHKDFDDLCALQPTKAEPLCLRSSVFASLGDSSRSLADAREACRLEPNNPMASLTLAFCFADEVDLKACQEHIDKTLALDPKYAPAHYFRAVIYHRSDPRKCLEAINKFLDLSPHYRSGKPHWPYYCKGYNLTVLNRPTEAFSSLLMARTLGCSSPDVAQALAVTYGDLGKFHLACHYAEECIRLRPEASVGYCLAAKYYVKADRIEQARASARKLKESFLPSDSSSSYTVANALADVEYALGNFRAVMAHFDKALENDPAHFFALMGKASLLATCPDARFRDGPRALQIASKAYQSQLATLDWVKWEPAMILAEAYAESGRFEEAVRYAKEALQLAGPDFGGRDEFSRKLSNFERRIPWRRAPKR